MVFKNFIVMGFVLTSGCSSVPNSPVSTSKQTAKPTVVLQDSGKKNIFPLAEFKDFGISDHLESVNIYQKGDFKVMLTKSNTIQEPDKKSIALRLEELIVKAGFVTATYRSAGRVILILSPYWYPAYGHIDAEGSFDVKTYEVTGLAYTSTGQNVFGPLTETMDFFKKKIESSDPYQMLRDSGNRTAPAN
ncbi:MAG: hypothetical protein AAB870_04715 [Patescibacteria group bacterium]